MSILSDLLSKTKRAKPRVDLPPGLTNSIDSYKKKERNRKHAILLIIIVFGSVASGLAVLVFLKQLAGNASPVASNYGRVVKNDLNISAPAHPDASRPGRSEKNPGTEPNIQSINVTPSKKTPVATTLKPSSLTDSKRVGKIKTAQPVDSEMVRVKEPGKAGIDIKTVKEPVEEVHEDVTLLYYQARDYEKAGEMPKAIRSYSKALRLEPGNYKLMNKIASIYMNLKLWNDASIELKRSIEIKGDYVPALINSGIVSAELGRFKESAGNFKKALSIDPASELTLFNIALLYEKQGMISEAREYYLKLKHMGDPRGSKGLKRIENLRSG